jgi:hypothetical protein
MLHSLLPALLRKHHLGRLLADPGVSPNLNGLPGIQEFKKIVGALLTFGVIACVAGLVVAGITWAIGIHSSNPHLAGRAKTGVIVAFGAALLIGGADFLIGFFWDAGNTLS